MRDGREERGAEKEEVGERGEGPREAANTFKQRQARGDRGRG